MPHQQQLQYFRKTTPKSTPSIGGEHIHAANKNLNGHVGNGRVPGVGGGGGAGIGGEEYYVNRDVTEKLLEENCQFSALINEGEENEMEITGYTRSIIKTVFCWIGVVLTAGILRLVLHWWHHWYLLTTHKKTTLDKAEKVLVREDYQGKHQLYYVKDVVTLNWDLIKKLKAKGKSIKYFDLDPELKENDFHLSVHFASGEIEKTDCVKMFHCKQLRYIWNKQKQSFQQLRGLDVDIDNNYMHNARGLPPTEQNARRIIYGTNEITIPYKGVVTLLFLEALNPFYVFQIFSVVLWFNYDYYYYASVIVIMSVFGIAMSIKQTKKNQDALRSTVLNNDCALVIHENGESGSIQTRFLVPGDVIEIPSSGCIMQCDAVLLSGNCILDESMLTGESVPVTKTPLPMKRGLIFDKKEHSRHTLFCGTKVIQTRYIGSEKVLAFVINTGNITAKGGLIRSILYPPPVDYKFEQDSYKFITLLACIAGIGFTYSLVTKILNGVDAVKLAVESLDLITIVVPPALPAAMTVGRLYAQKRLEKNMIYCISPRSINVSGSIDCVCFDKTGTLTEDGLDMWGVVPKTSTNNFQIPLKQVDRLPVDHFLFGMTTCHSITIMGGEMKGDPLDLKMFESTGWILEDNNVPDENNFDCLFPTVVRQPKSSTLNIDDRSNNSHTFASTTSSNSDNDYIGSGDNISSSASDFNTKMQKRESVDDLIAGASISNDIGIVREFTFTSSLQRMSVITRKLSDDHFNVYCKGSPEMIHTLCLSETLPSSYFQQLDIYAQQGYRIIALAYKPLEKKLTYPKIQRIGRDIVESGLNFLGFVILENRLKPDTNDVIKELISANIRTIMVTGDNVLTALSVAKDCGMICKKQSVITVNARHVATGEDQKETYELFYNLTGAGITSTVSPTANGISNGHITNSNSIASLETEVTLTHRDAETGIENDEAGNPYDEDKMYPVFSYNNYRFAMVGNTWSVIRERFADLIPFFVTRGTIFARMSPDQKQQLIMELQDIGYYVAMCGDGANDCGALKAAHTGISLSEAESSVASPFTSRNPTIACVPKVIKEGRAALVTSFGIFKFMAAFSVVQFVSVIILYSIASNLSDKQFLYIDLFLISILAFFFGKTESYSGPMAKQTPLSSLIALTPIASIVIQITVIVLFQLMAWYHLHSEPWFEPFVYDKDNMGDDYVLPCYENYTMYVVTCFQYLILGFVFSKGKPYRKSIISNIPLCLAFLANICFVIYSALYPPEWLANFMGLKLPPAFNFRYFLIFYGIANLIVAILIEEIIIEWLLFKKLRYRFHNIEKSRRKYLSVENSMRKNSKWPPLSIIQNDCSSLNIDNEKVIAPVSYAEIGAEQNDNKVPENSVLNSFFEEADNESLSDYESANGGDKFSTPIKLNGNMELLSMPEPTTVDDILLKNNYKNTIS